MLETRQLELMHGKKWADDCLAILNSKTETSSSVVPSPPELLNKADETELSGYRDLWCEMKDDDYNDICDILDSTKSIEELLEEYQGENQEIARNFLEYIKIKFDREKRSNPFKNVRNVKNDIDNELNTTLSDKFNGSDFMVILDQEILEEAFQNQKSNEEEGDEY